MVHAIFKCAGEVIYERSMKVESLPSLGDILTVPGSQRQYVVGLIHRKYGRIGIQPVQRVFVEVARKNPS